MTIQVIILSVADAARDLAAPGSLRLVPSP